MERRMTGNCHVRCGVGEKAEIASKPYLSLLTHSLDRRPVLGGGFAIKRKVRNLRTS